jgi:hypothetical protein
MVNPEIIQHGAFFNGSAPFSDTLTYHIVSYVSNVIQL